MKVARDVREKRIQSNLNQHKTQTLKDLISQYETAKDTCNECNSKLIAKQVEYDNLLKDKLAKEQALDLK